MFYLVKADQSLIFRFLFRSQPRKLVFLFISALCLTQPPTPGNLLCPLTFFEHPLSTPTSTSKGHLLVKNICDVKSENEWNLIWKRRKECFLRKAKWVYIINIWEWKGKWERKKKAGSWKRKEGRKKRGWEARGMELRFGGEYLSLFLLIGGKLEWKFQDKLTFKVKCKLLSITAILNYLKINLFWDGFRLYSI